MPRLSADEYDINDDLEYCQRNEIRKLFMTYANKVLTPKEEDAIYDTLLVWFGK